MSYYPNGKLYTVKSYLAGKKPFLKQCNDSTGVVLAENGKGKWIKFDEEPFKMPYIEGDVVNGIEEGEWRGKENDTVDIIRVYKNGAIISSKALNKSGIEVKSKLFTVVDTPPEFPGGFEAFYKFLERNTHYPARAYEDGVEGRVIMGFIVEKNGELSNVRVIKGIGSGCDEEAIRVIKASPPWHPGYQNGKPVRCAYSVPIAFPIH